MKKYHLLAIAALCTTTQVQAEWRVATSNLLTVYSEEDEAKLRETVTNLEKYDKIIRAFSNTNRPGSPVKLTVFMVRDMEAVAATLPYETYGIGGYYSASERGPFLISTRRGTPIANTRRTDVDKSKEWGGDVLQHEYGHHFMYQYFPGLYPTWYSEGFAEFYGSMSFKPSNIVEVGHAPLYRMSVIRSGWYPMRKILTAKNYDDVGENISNLYAQGWLLTHYAANNAVRGKQLTAYLKAIGQGVAYGDAAKTAFGDDIDKLDKEMQAHAKKLSAMRLSIKPMDVGEVKIRTLTAAEAAMLKTEIRLNSGFKRSDLPLIVKSGRAIVAGNPKDIGALTTQMEVERLAGNASEAASIADTILAIDAGNAKANMIKAIIQIDALQATKEPLGAKWDSVRDGMAKLIKKSPNSPQLLAAYYDSFTKQGILPPPGAQNALMRAHELLPRDSEIRYKLALDFEQRGMLEEAIYIISPEAFGSFDGDEKKDEKKKLKEKKQLAEFAAKFTGITVRESAKDMYDRLIAKQKPASGQVDAAVKQN